MSQSAPLAISFMTERNLNVGEMKEPKQANNSMEVNGSQWKQAASTDGQAMSKILFIIRLTSIFKEGYGSHVQTSWDT